MYVKYKTDIIENMHKKIEDMEFVLEIQAEIEQKQDRLLSIFRLYTFINMLIWDSKSKMDTFNLA